MKKILLIVGIILIIGIVIFFMFGMRGSQQEGESRIGFSLQEFFPFGRSGDSSTTTTENTFPINENESFGGSETDENKPIPRLRKLSGEPVAGSIMFNVGTTSVVRFIEKGTGNVYEARSDSNKIERLTNTTIPKIIRAFWLPNGTGFLAQTLIPNTEIIETSFVKLNQRNGEDSLGEVLTPYVTSIAKLPTGIKEISIRPDGAKIFYYIQNRNYTNWYISNPDGTGSEMVYAHNLAEWLPKWISTNTIIMQTKSSYIAPSYTYTFSPQTKILKKQGFGYNGLSLLPKQDNLFSLISIGGINTDLYLLNDKTFETSAIVSNAIAEKCVWSKTEDMFAYCAIPNSLPNSTYPDSWYKGIVRTEDSIRKIDLNNNIFYNVIDLKRESEEEIDVVDILISSDDTHLIFKNKTDGFLWMLRVEN